MQPTPPGQPRGPLPPVPQPPPPPAVPETPAGWYADPWAMHDWRWWDGHMWTAHIAGDGVGPAEEKPKLKGWLSWPIIVGLVLAVPLTIAIAIQTPLAIPLAFMPLLSVGPVLWWIDRIEPEPFQDRLHAFLWGATISGVVAGIVNSIVAVSAGDAVAAVVSAPFSEEIMKALGIVWAFRRREIDGVMDGIVYAGWVALGFAVVENFLYLSDAIQQGQLIAVFIARGILTPFAHPLFTFWSGLAVGWAVSRQKSIGGQLAWGLPIAIALHAAWNGSLTIAEQEELVLLIAIPGFILLFIACGIALVKIRGREQAAFLRQVPALSQRYGLTAQEMAIFGDWRTMLATRKRLDTTKRTTFDEVHGTLARLAALHARPGPLDAEAEAVLVSRLNTARSG